MSIAFKKYVRITSGVGGGGAVRLRELIARIFTTNALVSPDSVLEFTSPDDVGDFFGTASQEYLRAVFYWLWISPSITQVSKISFARYTPNAIAPIVYGGQLTSTLGQLQAITAGLLSIVTPSGTVALNTVNLSGAASLAAVAATLQTKIRTSADPLLVAATVAYDVANARFVITGGATGAGGTLSLVQVGAGNTDVGALCDLYESAGAFSTVGANAQAPVDAVTAMNDVSNNYGSFCFAQTITMPQIVAVATYNAAQNVQYQYHVGVSLANAVAMAAALTNIASVGLTIVDLVNYPNEFDEMCPMIQLAATDYARLNGVTSYMYKQFALTPKVTDTPTSDAMDAIRVNYYGVTQLNGQFVAFYQDGVLFGSASAPVDMNVHANEQWLKGFLAVEFINTLLALQIIDAGTEGLGICKTVVQTGVDAGLFNGTVSVGKVLTNLQKLYITQQTGDENAWQQVQTIGYWYNVVIVPEVEEGGNTIYKAVYLLIYSKSDAVRRVEGTHILI